MNAVLAPTYTVSFDNNTGKLTFLTGDDSSDFQIVADTKNYRYLGSNKSTTNSSSSGSLSSGNIVVEIHSNLHLHSENSNNRNNDFLVRVYPNSDVFSNIFYNAQSFEDMY